MGTAPDISVLDPRAANQKSGHLDMSPLQSQNLDLPSSLPFSARRGTRSSRPTRPVDSVDAKEMEWTRLLASPSFFLIVLAGFVLIAVLTLGVPQGWSDSEVLSSYPLSMGPFIVLFGLHRIGGAIPLWAVVVALFLHLGALLTVRRTRPDQDSRRIPFSSPVLLLSASLVLVSLFGLVGSSSLGRTSGVSDTTRLRVRVADAPFGAKTQVVEEGALYEVPGPVGPRTILFGVVSRGPFALEQASDGSLRVHLPGSLDESRPRILSVEARRPQVQSASSGLLPFPPPWLGFGCVVFAAVTVVTAIRRALALPGRTPHQVTWSLAAILALLVFNPLAGPGRARTPLEAALGSGEVAWTPLVRTPLDVSAWLSFFPAETVVPAVWWANLLAAITAAFFVIATLSIPEDRSPGRIPRVLAGVVSGATILSGLAWLVHSAGRIPVLASASDLLGVFETEVLPRIPSEIEVLALNVTHPGPYFVPIQWGVAAVLTSGVCAWVFARFARARGGRTGPGPSVVRVVWIGLIGMATLRAAWLSVSADMDGGWPAAWISVLVTALVPIVTRGHPEWPAGGLVTMAAGASMQLAIPL